MPDAPTQDLSLHTRILAAVAKVDAALAHTLDRRQRDDLLDIRIALTGKGGRP